MVIIVNFSLLLGKILIKWLKTPWFLIKCCCRRTFRYCTKQSMAEIKKLDDEDKKDLEVFDLPLFVAVFVVLAWIFICSATFCIWEEDWDYFVAFYFFFISLSTIGLGDISPSQPKYLLILFIYIIIGLSLVSMCINLIQVSRIMFCIKGDNIWGTSIRRKSLFYVHLLSDKTRTNVPNRPG